MEAFGEVHFARLQPSAEAHHRQHDNPANALSTKGACGQCK
jgi:hypothetical protein